MQGGNDQYTDYDMLGVCFHKFVQIYCRYALILDQEGYSGLHASSRRNYSRLRDRYRTGEFGRERRGIPVVLHG